MRVAIAKAAEHDLLDIQERIAADNPTRAAGFIAELERVCVVMLRDTPFLGPARDDISPGLRVHPHKGYLICYRVKRGVVRIVRIFHASYDVTRRF